MTDTAVPLTDRGRRTREALVVAAARVFAERGYAGTRMQDVAAAAGVSHGTVYTWFAKKDDLLRAVTHVIVGEVFDASRDRTDEPADPYERLSSANRRFLASYRRHARMLAVAARRGPGGGRRRPRARRARPHRHGRDLRPPRPRRPWRPRR